MAASMQVLQRKCDERPAQSNGIRHERIAVSDGEVVDIVTDADGFDPVEVWLNSDVGDYDGLIIGIADTRESALDSAIYTLETALGTLKSKRGGGA